MTPIESLIASGSKVWLDSVDPDLSRRNFAWGITGATSNPAIVSDLIATGRFDADIDQFLSEGLDDSAIAWRLTDRLVCDAEGVFRPVWEQTEGDDGYVSFELDPLLEDPDASLKHEDRVARYVALGRQWAAGHTNRMIKVPATPAGIGALERLVASGIKVNVTLIFTLRQYRAAREAIWRGARNGAKLGDFKCVYSIFVSRIDSYTAKAVPELSPAAQGMVGVVMAKQIWAENQAFWSQRPQRLQQGIVMASMGTKRPEDPPWRYVESLAGGDIQTNPPATNEAVAGSGRTLVRLVDRMPPEEVLREIEYRVDVERLEQTLMEEGIRKFVEPQKKLLAMVAEKRMAVAAR